MRRLCRWVCALHCPVQQQQQEAWQGPWGPPCAMPMQGLHWHRAHRVTSAEVARALGTPMRAWPAGPRARLHALLRAPQAHPGCCLPHACAPVTPCALHACGRLRATALGLGTLRAGHLLRPAREKKRPSSRRWHPVCTATPAPPPAPHPRWRHACRLIDPKNSRRYDDCIKYTMVSAKKALQQAGLEKGANPDGHGKLDMTRVGVLVGTGMGGLTVFQDGACACACMRACSAGVVCSW